MCLYYSVEQTMICLGAKKITREVLRIISELNNEAVEDHVVRVIYGVVAMIVQPEGVPEEYRKDLGGLFAVLVELCGQILNKNHQKNEDSSMEGSNDVSILALSDHELYASPLKKVYVLYHVKLKLEELNKKNPLYYSQLEGSLSKEARTNLNTYMLSADEIQNEL